jgi:hypothetical protein
MADQKQVVQSDLRKVDRHEIASTEYHEAPELSEAQLAGSEVKRQNGKMAGPKT